VPVIALDNLIDDGKVSANGKFLIKLDVEGVEIEAAGGCRRQRPVVREHGNDPAHRVSLLLKNPAEADRHDPRSNRETVTDLSILDRIKVSTHVSYNVFGTASAFWLGSALNAARRAQ
jgi:hypothetical protein